MPSKKLVLVYTKADMIQLAREEAFSHENFNNPACMPKDVVELEDGSVQITIHEKQ